MVVRDPRDRIQSGWRVAWSVVVGVGVLVGIAAGIAQIRSDWRAPGPSDVALSTSAASVDEDTTAPLEGFASEDWNDLVPLEPETLFPFDFEPGTSIEEVRAFFGDAATENRLAEGPGFVRTTWTWQGIEYTALVDEATSAIAVDTSNVGYRLYVSPESPWTVVTPRKILLGHTTLAETERTFAAADVPGEVREAQEEAVSWVEGAFKFGDDEPTTVYKTEVAGRFVPLAEGCGEPVRGYEVHILQAGWMPDSGGTGCP